MKRILPLLLALLLLTACASKGATIPQKPQRETDKTTLSTQPPVASTQTLTTTEPAPTEPETTEPQGQTMDEQLSVLAQCGGQWFQEAEYSENYQFCVTDLDQDGRLELIFGSMQGSGLFTFFSIYRVQDGGLQTLTDAMREESLPDLIVQSAPVYEKDGRYYYHFEDVMRNGVAEGMKDNVLFCLDADELTFRSVAYLISSYAPDSSEPTVSYYDAKDVQIDEAAYERIVGDPMPDAKRWSAAFRWISAPEKEPPQEELLSMLTQSWEGFSLQPIE